MPDTTTPNLWLVKIGVGGSRDTWGDKVNGNMDAIDAAVKLASDKAATADAKLPKAGGTITGEITRDGEGVVPHYADAGMTHGRIFLAPAAGSDPTSQPGDIWLGY